MPALQRTGLAELFKVNRSARRQAKLKRLLSPYAFAGALEQPQRWHLFYDGSRVLSVVALGLGASRTWSAGPVIAVAELQQPDVLQSRAKELLQSGKTVARYQAGLGVVLHLADQLDPGILQEEFENPEVFELASALIRESPERVVTDLSGQSDPTVQWRYYPIFCAQRAVALRHQIEFLTAFETLSNFDVKVAVHSAPVEMFALYLRLYEQASEERPHCFVFFYDRFTVIAPVHQGVLDFRALPHRQQNVPAAFGDDLFSLLEKLGFIDSCVLLLVACGTHDPTLLFHELDTYARRNQKNADGIEIQIPDSETVWSVLREYTHGQLQPAIVQRSEFLSEYSQRSGKEFPLTLSIAGDLERFAMLSRQTFWPDDQESRDKRLPKSVAILMMGLRIGQICGLLLLMGLGAWFALFVAAAYHNEAFSVSSQLISSERAEFDQLNGTKQYLSKWEKILAPRSQAWAIMDFVLDLLPEGNTVICEKLEYAIKQAESKPTGPQAATPGGFSRQWVIDGFCNDQGSIALEHLQETSTLAKVFMSTATRLGDPGFAVSGNRSVKAVLRQETNSQSGNGSKMGALPYQFRLVITQAIPANDPLALPVLPKPTKTAMPS